MPELTATPDLMSPLNLFMQADVVVKAVMLGLLLASVWTWAIIFTYLDPPEADQSRHRQVRAGLLGDQRHRRVPRPARLGAADCGGHVRGARRMAPIDQDQAGRSRRNPRTPRQPNSPPPLRRIRSPERPSHILATVGSVAPFVGLFGTVWGIMRSHRHRRRQQPTLAVVAPGIAEACSRPPSACSRPSRRSSPTTG